MLQTLASDRSGDEAVFEDYGRGRGGCAGPPTESRDLNDAKLDARQHPGDQFRMSLAIAPFLPSHGEGAYSSPDFSYDEFSSFLFERIYPCLPVLRSRTVISILEIYALILTLKT